MARVTPGRTTRRFEVPVEVDRFGEPTGGGGIYDLMPAYQVIPDEFKDWNRPTPFNEIQSDWFFRGFKAWPLRPRPGIDPAKALAHLSAIQRSWEPKHEHKCAAVAYLMSLWFEAPDVTKGGKEA